MFIRRTQTRNTTTGESYYTYRLVRSERVGRKVRQVTLLNLGRHFDVDQGQWPTLCARIEELLSNQASLVAVDCPPPVETAAQRIAAQLLARQQVQPEPPETPAPEYTAVDVDSMAMVRPRSVGVEQLALWAMQQVDFTGLLRQAGFTGPQRAAAIGSIVGRMAAPASELATHRWLGERSGLGELLDVDFEAVPLIQLYRASDRLLRSRAMLESALFNRVGELFGLTTTVTLYDLTNTYFEGEVGGIAKAKRGRSKEKRNDAPLLTLGVVLDGSGFVRRSEIFAGNAIESRTLAEMLAGLGAPTGALVVMDAGIANQETITWLRERGYRYLVVSRQHRRTFHPDHAVTLSSAAGESVHLEKVLSEDGEEALLYCYSERRQKKEEAINERFAQRFEAGLQKIADGLGKPRTTKRLDKLWERIGRLKEASRGMGQHFQVELVPDEKGERAVAIHWRRQPVEGTRLTHPGVYCLRSNETSWDEERLWRTYIMLTDLEAVFRSLKSELGLRPIFHHTEERAEGHLFITVLAYQFVQIIRRQLKEKGLAQRWHTLRELMMSQCRVTAVFNRPDGHTLHVRKATRPEPGQMEIYQALGVNPLPGGTKKLTI